MCALTCSSVSYFTIQWYGYDCTYAALKNISYLDTLSRKYRHQLTMSINVNNEYKLLVCLCWQCIVFLTLVTTQFKIVQYPPIALKNLTRSLARSHRSCCRAVSRSCVASCLLTAELSKFCHRQTNVQTYWIVTRHTIFNCIYLFSYNFLYNVYRCVSSSRCLLARARKGNII